MKWINVNKRLPLQLTKVLALGTDGEQWVMTYSHKRGWRCPLENWSIEVTHWMPLPELPNIDNTER